MVVQVALSLLLLVGAGLFVRTLLNLQRVDPGFNTQNLLLFEVQPALIGYKDEKLRSFISRSASAWKPFRACRRLLSRACRYCRRFEFEQCVSARRFVRAARLGRPHQAQR